MPLQLLGMLMIVSVTNSVTNGMALYLRAHKKEPMMLISLISGVLIGGSVWFFGAKFGPQGAVYSYFVLALVWGLPSTIVVFTRFKRRWHNDAINGAEL